VTGPEPAISNNDVPINASARVLAELRKLLAKGIELNHADFGNIQIFHPWTKSLRIIVHKGFKKDFISHFQIVKLSDSTCCGRAASSAVPVIIPDVMQELGYEKHRATAEAAGYRSVMSHPILKPDGSLCGILSTHCRKTRSDWDTFAVAGLLPEIAAVLMTILKSSGV
jgi:GAF domain-containing protein